MQEDNNYVIHGPPPAEPLLDVTLGTLIHRSLLDNPGDHDAMVDAFSGQTISYKTLLQQSCLLAESLRVSGFGKGTIISISSENSLEFFIPVLSCLYLGAPLFPLNHSYTKTELSHVVKLAEPQVIFCSKILARKFIELRNELNTNEKILVIDSNEDFEGLQCITNFIKHNLKGQQVDYSKFQPYSENQNETAFLMCSSGTTGLPKCVMLSHRNLMVRIMQSRDPQYLVFSKKDNVLGILPFFHAYGLITTFSAILDNQKVVMLKQFDEDVFLKSIQDYKISVLILAPPLAVFLVKSPKVLKYDLSSVKDIICGAAPMSKFTEEALTKRFNIERMRQGYGLTEATLAVIVQNLENYRAGSTGKVMSFMSCKVRDPETGKSLGPNKVGELCFKGPMIMLGYYKNRQATKDTFTSDGWLKTGDLGYYDDDKYFYIVDRLKELIKYKGFQVAPAELEAILLTNPKIRDAGVVGVPDELCGELPLAFVVKHEGEELTEKEVEGFVASLVSPQKRLRGGVIFVPEIPKNPSGKILRRELRQLLSKYKAKL